MRALWGQRGMTLLELLVAAAVGAVLTTGAAAAIYQSGKLARWGGDELRAWHDIRSGVYWMGRDIPMAETTDLVDGAGPVSSLSLTWTEHSEAGDIPHTSSYYLVGSELKRDYDGSVITVARHIQSLGFSLSQRLITVSLSSSPGEPAAAENMTYMIYLRPD